MTLTVRKDFTSACFIVKWFTVADFLYARGGKRKANIFENCTCQQVNKAKNTADKQRSP